MDKIELFCGFVVLIVGGLLLFGVVVANPPPFVRVYSVALGLFGFIMSGAIFVVAFGDEIEHEGGR